ncbi:MAG: hypothetical protein M3T55_14950, partial [Pseudomonadota bacterium]|nr:hypothetical protein [Pseudomonadota bacterium]
DKLTAADSGSTLDGGGGNDSLIGGAGSDTFVFNHGYGVETITDTATGSNTLRIGGGLNFDNLWISYNNDTNNTDTGLRIGERGGSGYVAIAGDTVPFSNANVIKTLDMAGAGQVDLSVVTYLGDGSDGVDTEYGSPNHPGLIFTYGGNDTIYGSGNVSSQYGSVIDAGLGNDMIVTSSGDDQFLFERGDGADSISDTGGQNTIVFGSTVAASDVIYQVVGNDLFVGLTNPSNLALTASQVSDRMDILGGGVRYTNVSTGVVSWNTLFFVQAGGTTVNLSQLPLGWTNVITGQGGSGGGDIPPIVLDLTGDGLELTPVAQSDIVTKDASSGLITRTGWVGPTNGILAVDRAGDGNLATIQDISFLQDKPGATSDLQGLAAWDTNGDGIIDANDTNFGKLLVWVDANQDGRAEAGEVSTLTQLGIASISLAAQPTGFDGTNTSDSYWTSTTTFTRSDGTSGSAYDVSLAREFLGETDDQTPAGVNWSDVSLDGAIGQLQGGPPPNSPNAAMENASLSYAQFSKNFQTNFSATGGVMSAADRARWGYLLDPKVKAALAHQNSAANLAAIRGSTPYAYLNPGAASPPPPQTPAPTPTQSTAPMGASPPEMASSPPSLAASGQAPASVTVSRSAGIGPQDLGVSAPAANLAGTLAAWWREGSSGSQTGDPAGSLAQLLAQSLAPSEENGPGAARPDAATAQRLQ